MTTEPKPITLQEWSDRIGNATINAMIPSIVESITRGNPLTEGYEPTPLTRRQRIAIYIDRIRDAWDVLRGRKEARDYWDD